MSENLNAEAKVAELLQPGQEAALEQALTEEFNSATKPAESKPAEADEAETKIANPGEKTSDKEGAHLQPGEKAGEADTNNKENSFKNLLADRNEAKAKAAEALTENQILSKQVSELTELVQKLSAGNSNDGAANDDSADDTPLTKKEVDAYLEQKLQEKLAASQKTEAAEKSLVEEIRALEENKLTPNAKEYADDIKAIMSKHPTLSAYAAYRMLQGEGIIPGEVFSSNANRTGTGNRSKSNLLKNVKPGDMTQAELEAHLKNEEKSGNLNGLI